MSLFFIFRITVGVSGLAKTDLEGLQSWHELLDALCNNAGHHDNTALASAYCQHVGRTGRDDFEAAQKNLRNWRLGRHVPLRRNAIILARLLEIDIDSNTYRRWLSLHAEARGVSTPDPTGKPEPGARSSPERSSRRHVLAAGAAAAVLCAVLTYQYRQFSALPLVGYEARILMHVGESRLIHGDYGSCGSTPPDWQYMLGQIPISTLGEFSDGGIAKKMANNCDRVVKVRAVRFTARQAGSEEITILGDFMKLEVGDAGYLRPQ